MVLAAYVGVVIAARLLRRDTWSKLLFNVSYATLTIAITDLLARLAFEPAWPQLPRWLAVLAGFVIAHAITSWLTWVFIVLLDDRRPGESARPVVHLYLTGLLNAALGVIAAETVRMVPWGALLVGLLTVTVAAVYRAYYGLLRDHRDLGVLNDLSLRVTVVGRGGAGQGGDDDEPELDTDAWSSAMEVARVQLNATRVAMHRMPAQGGLHTVVAGLALPLPLSQQDLDAVVRAERPTGTGQVLRLVDTSPEPAIAAALTVRGAWKYSWHRCAVLGSCSA